MRIDLLDAIAGKLKKIPAVERRSGMRGRIDGANFLAGLRIKRVELVSGRKPDVLAVVGHARHVVDARKGAVFAKDFGLRFFHGVTF